MWIPHLIRHDCQHMLEEHGKNPEILGYIIHVTKLKKRIPRCCCFNLHSCCAAVRVPWSNRRLRFDMFDEKYQKAKDAARSP